ncbi:MAG: hypoxanthine phosphoribosyltransferase [Paludibacteraceae bacterium]|nr:hypoxanthine phosphoribosyltransferase [Paludibacteraceae bacterium]
MADVVVKDKVFTEFISKNEMNTVVTSLAKKVEEQFKDKSPIFIVMLNGAFVFASDFLRALEQPYETLFVRYSSYSGMQTTGNVVTSAIPDVVKGRNVVILEDIVDSGLTMEVFKKNLTRMQPESITLVALLSKPSARKVDVKIDYIGKEIEDKFVVGYGLDYDGFGRNLPAIYVLKE